MTPTPVLDHPDLFPQFGLKDVLLRLAPHHAELYPLAGEVSLRSEGGGAIGGGGGKGGEVGRGGGGRCLLGCYGGEDVRGGGFARQVDGRSRGKSLLYAPERAGGREEKGGRGKEGERKGWKEEENRKRKRGKDDRGEVRERGEGSTGRDEEKGKARKKGGGRERGIEGIIVPHVRGIFWRRHSSHVPNEHNIIIAWIVCSHTTWYQLQQSNLIDYDSALCFPTHEPHPHGPL